MRCNEQKWMESSPLINLIIFYFDEHFGGKLGKNGTLGGEQKSDFFPWESSIYIIHVSSSRRSIYENLLKTKEAESDFGFSQNPQFRKVIKTIQKTNPPNWRSQRPNPTRKSLNRPLFWDCPSTDSEGTKKIERQRFQSQKPKLQKKKWQRQ